jgi:hypothetical protein
MVRALGRNGFNGSFLDFLGTCLEGHGSGQNEE